MHVWNLWGSVPPTRLRTTGLHDIERTSNIQIYSLDQAGRMYIDRPIEGQPSNPPPQSPGGQIQGPPIWLRPILPVSGMQFFQTFFSFIFLQSLLRRANFLVFVS